MLLRAGLLVLLTEAISSDDFHVAEDPSVSLLQLSARPNSLAGGRGAKLGGEFNSDVPEDEWDEADDVDDEEWDEADASLLEEVSNETDSLGFFGYKRCREAPRGSHSACKVVGGGARNFASTARNCAGEAKKIGADSFQFLPRGGKCWLKRCNSVNMKYSTEGRTRPWQIFSTYCGLERVHEQKHGSCGTHFTNWLKYPMPPKSACDTALKFTGMKSNNLNGWGPAQGAEAFRFAEVLPGVDLVVKADNSYQPNNAERNGVYRRKFGRLNMKSGIDTTMLFRFVESEGQTPVKVDQFMFSVFDIDQGAGCQSRLTVNASGFASYHVHDETELIVATDTGGVGWQASTTFQSSKHGTKKDNPLWPDRLNNRQQKRAVTFFFEDTKFFSMNFKISPGKGGRNLLFSGRSSLMDSLCGVHRKGNK